MKNVKTILGYVTVALLVVLAVVFMFYSPVVASDNEQQISASEQQVSSAEQQASATEQEVSSAEQQASTTKKQSNETGYSFNEYNSILVYVEVPEKTVFTPEHFPEINCTEIVVASMGMGNEGYRYELLLVLADGESQEAAKEAVAENEMFLSFPYSNHYVTYSSYMELSEKEITLEIGQSADVQITDLTLKGNAEVPANLYVKIDWAKFDAYENVAELIDHYGLGESEILCEPPAEGVTTMEYFFEANWKHGELNEKYVSIINEIVQLEGVEGARIHFDVIVGGCIPTETWIIEDETVATLSLSGGELDEALGQNLLNQTATVTAKAVGTTKLTANRTQGTANATAECTITVIHPEFTVVDGVLTEYKGTDTVITVPSGVKKIGADFLKQDKNVQKVILPEGLTEIERCAFENSSVTEVHFPDSLESIGDYVFAGSELTTVTYNEELDFDFGYRAFANCKNLKNEQGLTIVGNILVNGMGANTEEGTLIVPEGVTIIGSSAFEEAWQIKKMVLPDGLKKICNDAFFLCSYLEEINLPQTLTYIGRSAFSGVGFDSLEIPDSVTYVGDYAFDHGNRDGLHIYAKYGSAAYHYSVKYGNEFTPTNMEDYEIQDNVLIKYLGDDTDVYMPETLVGIADEAFAGNTTITKVTVPEGVTYIGDKAFQNCTALSEINLPDSLTSIGYAAFDHCTSLYQLTLPVGIKSLEHSIFSVIDYNYRPDEEGFGVSHLKLLKIMSPEFKVTFDDENYPHWSRCLVNLRMVCGNKDTDAKVIAEDTEATFLPLEIYLVQRSMNYSNNPQYMGDVDLDGEVTAEDALLLLKWIVKLDVEVAKDRRNVDGVDGTNAADALAILRRVVQLEEHTLCEPKAFETHQFAVDGRALDEGTKVSETKVIRTKRELDTYLNSILEQCMSDYNEDGFDDVKAHFAAMDDDYFLENVCVVTFDVGKLGWGTYKSVKLVNQNRVEEGYILSRRGLIMEYHEGTDTRLPGMMINDCYILISGTTIPYSAMNDATLESVTINAIPKETAYE